MKPTFFEQYFALGIFFNSYQHQLQKSLVFPTLLVNLNMHPSLPSNGFHVLVIRLFEWPTDQRILLDEYPASMVMHCLFKLTIARGGVSDIPR